MLPCPLGENCQVHIDIPMVLMEPVALARSNPYHPYRQHQDPEICACMENLMQRHIRNHCTVTRKCLKCEDLVAYPEWVAHFNMDCELQKEHKLFMESQRYPLNVQQRASLIRGMRVARVVFINCI